MDKENISYSDKVKQQREENLTYLQSLNIAEVSNPMVKHEQEKRQQITEYRAAKRAKKKQEVIVPRRSQRSLNTQPIPAMEKETAESLDFSSIVFDKKEIPSDLSKCFKDVVKGKFKASKESAFKIYHSKFKSMKLTANSVAKLAMATITSIAVHPSPSPILVCSGSGLGEIGFWSITSKDMNNHICRFKPHAHRVSCIAFAPEDNSKLYSSSFDGSVRCADLQSLIFKRVYKSDDRCSYFDFMSPSTLLVGHKKGAVHVVDTRTENSGIFHQTHNSAITMINSHPVKKSYFIVAESNGLVTLWDVRKLKKNEPVSDIHHDGSVHGAYFSPVTGNSILTTCIDNFLRVFDSSKLKNIDLQCHISQNNSMRLYPVKAVWLPNDEQTFVVSSMLQPRGIQVYDITGNIVHNFQGEYLTTICPVNVFHDSEPVLAGGNSSGIIHVFMES